MSRLAQILSAFLFASSVAVVPLALITQIALAQVPPAKSKGPSAPAAQPNTAIQPQPSSGPDMTTETYGDWVMRCQKAGDTRRCEVSQTIVMQGQTAPIALIAFGRDKKDSPLRMVIQLPTNVTIDDGVQTLLASGDLALDLRFRRCFAIGCFADSTLTDPLIARLRGQTAPLRIRFKDGTEREIALPFSPKGLGPALDALARI